MKKLAGVFGTVDEAGPRWRLFGLAFWVEPQEANAARQLLTALGHLAPLLLADWGWSRCVDLSQPTEIEQLCGGESFGRSKLAR